MDRKESSENNEKKSLLNQPLIECQNENLSGSSALVEETYLENYNSKFHWEEQNETQMRKQKQCLGRNYEINLLERIQTLISTRLLKNKSQNIPG